MQYLKQGVYKTVLPIQKKGKEKARVTFFILRKRRFLKTAIEEEGELYSPGIDDSMQVEK